MITNVKALLVIMMLALTIFHFAKPICLNFIAENDYIRRKNIWLVLTVTAFISPSFWIYAVISFVLSYLSTRKDNNPAALFVMLMHVIPSFNVPLPSFIVNSIFDINNIRIMELAILMPVAWRLVNAKNKKNYGNHKAIDVLMFLYLVLQAFLLMPYEDITNTVRRIFLIVVDSMLLVYVASRTCSDKGKINEVMVTFCLTAAISVALALFEYSKVWLVYTGFSAVWDIPSQGLYLFRDGALRAQASAGHSLVLGYLLAVALGLWLFISDSITSKKYRFIGTTGLCLGLFATLSRGPWVTAVFIYVIYIVIDKNGVKDLLKRIAIMTPFIAAALFSPLGPKIIDKLPFVGTVDASNVEYRQRLAESSWELIKTNPFLGDPFYEKNLENMRQGEGIIDMVNVYAQISLLYGVVGLFLFFAPFGLSILKVWKKINKKNQLDSATVNMGRALVACMLGTALFIATASFILAIPVMYYLLIGLASAYDQLKDAPTNAITNSHKK